MCYFLNSMRFPRLNEFFHPIFLLLYAIITVCKQLIWKDMIGCVGIVTLLMVETIHTIEVNVEHIAQQTSTV